MKNNKEKYLIIRDREITLSPAIWNAVLQTSKQTEDIYGKALEVEYNTFINGRMQSILLKEEWDNTGKFIADKIINEKGYFESIRKKTSEAEKAILNFLSCSKKLNYTKLKFKALISEANKIKNLFMQYDAATVASWFIAGDILKERILQKTGLSHEDFEIVSLPEEKTQATQMEMEILSAIINSKNIKKSAEELSEKYYWMPHGYDGPTIFDEKHFLEKLSKESKETARKHLERMNIYDKEIKIARDKIMAGLSEKNKEFIQIIHDITLWTDERKMLEYKIFYYYGIILRELEKRFDIPIKNLRYLLTEELADLENNKARLLKISNERLSKDFLTITENGKIRFASNDEFKTFQEEIKKQTSTDEIKGAVVSKGEKVKYVAKVKVLSSPKECQKVSEGDFLVTSMTSPDFVPAMRKALGFITDEGGITCHAAIVAREMRKPCIIGTKIATKMLKDNDIVEMDINSGIVKILERAK